MPSTSLVLCQNIILTGLYALVIDDALKEFIGKGNGTLAPMDSGVLDMMLTLGW